MGKTILRSFTVAAVLVVLMASHGAARPDGTATELKSIPPFVKRLFVPLVAGANNRFSISDRPIDEVLEVPRNFELTLRNGVLHVVAPGGDAWGYARVRAGKRELTLTLMNMVSYGSVNNGLLDGYRIGKYAERPLRGLATYARPKGFIRLTRENREAWISDHYRLRDFQCKLDGPTKFLLVRPEALLKLELL